MTTRLMEVVVCDLCKHDRRATARREIDVCDRHDSQLAERMHEALYTCETCGREFNDPVRLRRHVTIHEKVETAVACPHCGREFPNDNSMHRHVGQKHKG